MKKETKSLIFSITILGTLLGVAIVVLVAMIGLLVDQNERIRNCEEICDTDSIMVNNDGCHCKNGVEPDGSTRWKKVEWR
jgi:hypothetical protein